MVALRAGADHGDAAAGQFLKTLHIVLAGFRQILELVDLGNILGPTRHGLVNRLCCGELSLVGRHVVATLAIHVVSHAQRNLLQTGEHVELGEHDVGQTVDLGRVTIHHRVEPAATTRTAGGHAILVALGAQPIAFLAEQLGRERTFAHTGHIRLGDADHAVDLGRTDAGTGACAAGGRVGGRHERVGAVVHVKHGGLTAFEQHGLAFVERLVEHQRRVGDVRLQSLTELEQLVGGRVHIDRTTVVQLHQHLVLLVQARLDLVVQVVGIEQVMHADAHTVNLVGVCRSDATAGGADLVLAKEALGHLVEHAVVRRDDMRAFAHQQTGAIHATALQTVDLLEQHFRIDDDAVADDRRHIRADDAGWQQVQRIRFIADHHGVPRVVAAVETCDIVDLRTNKIGSLTLAFIAPLGANQHDSRHNAPPRLRLVFRRKQPTVSPLPYVPASHRLAARSKSIPAAAHRQRGNSAVTHVSLAGTPWAIAYYRSAATHRWLLLAASPPPPAADQFRHRLE